MQTKSIYGEYNKIYVKINTGSRKLN